MSRQRQEQNGPEGAASQLPCLPQAGQKINLNLALFAPERAGLATDAAD
jgi:hypothetical protein